MGNNAIYEKITPLELPRESQPVEWWFFQGTYRTELGNQFEFMLSLFRVDVSLDDEPQTNGFSVIISYLDVETGENHVISRIDNTVLEGIFKWIRKLDETEIDKDIAKVLSKELKKHGPPRPIELAKSTAEISLLPFEIKWDNIIIKQNESGFHLQFYLPKIEKLLSLDMRPFYPRIILESEGDNKLFSGEMNYATYPRMQLTGNINGNKITGQAWFDHQWGNTKWFVTNDAEKKILGWDWFGINLSDGTDILITIHKLMKTKDEIITNAIVHTSADEVIVIKNVIAKPLRYWESPNTHIKYPIEWEIQIPEADLQLKFEPLADNQEIPVVGIGRALWEGAGRVTGTFNGEKINGRARAEFFGYGYIFDFQNYLQTLADRIDKRIEEFFPKKFDEEQVQKFVGKPYWQHEPSAYTEMLSIPVWDMILRRGKRWRPIFGILMLEALGKASEHYEASACLAELVHSGALIIDDIEDDSLLRRGEQCLHLKYGLDVALNAGNTLYFLPSVELFNHKYLDDKKKLRIHEIMMKTYLQAHFGQTVDIYWSKNLTKENLNKWMNDSLEDKILQMYDYKTAAGAKGLAEVAAVIAEVDEGIKQACINYARAFAVAFQIIDDVHNFSSSPRWTKICGEDISNGKLTFVIARAIRLLEDKRKRKLINILCSKELRKNNDASSEAIEYIRSSGALEVCKEIAKKISIEENDRFSDIVPSCEPKIMLNMLCLKMLDLAYDT